MRRLFFSVLIIFPLAFAGAQDIRRAGDAAPGIIPLALVLDAALRADGGPDFPLPEIWRPDWPLELPPDSFRAIAGNPRKLSVIAEGYSLSFSRGEAGYMEEFPLMLGGQMYQVSARYGFYPGILEMELSRQPNDAETGSGAAEAEANAGADAESESETNTEGYWKFEFPEGFSLTDLNYSHSPIRASYGGKWFFIFLSGAGKELLETWYDEEGNALGIYRVGYADIGNARRVSRFEGNSDGGAGINGRTECFFDSRAFLTETSGPRGVFKAGYFRDDLPRYWDRRPAAQESGGADEYYGASGNVSLQWDETGFLLRMTISDDGEITADSRYEYTLDGHGNWIERREIRMIRAFSYLVPAPGATVRRILEYGQVE